MTVKYTALLMLNLGPLPMGIQPNGKKPIGQEWQNKATRSTSSFLASNRCRNEFWHTARKAGGVVYFETDEGKCEKMFSGSVPGSLSHRNAPYKAGSVASLVLMG